MTKNFNIDKSFDQQLEREYTTSLQYLSDAQLINVFPEAVPYLKEKILHLKKSYKLLSVEILKDLISVYKLKDKISIDFWEQVVEVLKGEKLKDLDKEINHWKRLVFPPKETKNIITDNQIQTAKEYPFCKLIEARSNLAHCPFHHPDKHPSFSIKNNFGHCFACGWSGDTIKFLMESQTLNFRQAVEMLS
jgi:hypothetical protein